MNIHKRFITKVSFQNIAKEKQELAELNKKAFVKKIKNIIERRYKKLNTDQEKREFMDIFDHIYEDCHQITMRELTKISKYMSTRIENTAFDETNLNFDKLVSEEVKRLTQIDNKWKNKEQLIFEKLEQLKHKRSVSHTKDELETAEKMVGFEKKLV